jgi:(+)-pinoresinol hydroxylase
MSGTTRASALAVIMVAVAYSASALAQTSAIERGKAVFEHTCAPCHGTGGGNDGHAELPGTEALRIKYQGKLPAALERRGDLTAETIGVFVRNGVNSMPPFRKTELSDADIADIAAYLVDSAKKPVAR